MPNSRTHDGAGTAPPLSQAVRKMVALIDVDVRQSERLLGLCFLLGSAPTPSYAEQEPLFAELEDLLMDADNELVRTVMEDRRFQAIRRRLRLVRAQYEYERELVLARQVTAVGDDSPIKEFRAGDWYDLIHNYEIQALAPYHPKNILLVGSGSYPTTAFSLLRADPNVKVTCIDRDGLACQLSIELSLICGVDRLRVIWSDILDLHDLAQYDCIILACVAGVHDIEKDDIVQHVISRSSAQTLLALRTACGAGRIMYPSVDLSRLDGFDYRVLKDPPQKTVTMILAHRIALAS